MSITPASYRTNILTIISIYTNSVRRVTQSKEFFFISSCRQTVFLDRPVRRALQQSNRQEINKQIYSASAWGKKPVTLDISLRWKSAFSVMLHQSQGQHQDVWPAWCFLNKDREKREHISHQEQEFQCLHWAARIYGTSDCLSVMHSEI